jgi:REP element-mobilizing transposase RayT
MLSKVLVYSPHRSVLERINTWAQQGKYAELLALNSFEFFSQHLTENDYDGVIFDSSGSESQLTGLLQRLAMYKPAIKILILHAQGFNIEEDLGNTIKISMVSQPCEEEELIAALDAWVAVDRTPGADQNTSPNPAGDETEEDNLSYLKGWIEEDLLAKEMEEGVTKLPQEFLPPEVDELVNENEILSRQTGDRSINSEVTKIIEGSTNTPSQEALPVQTRQPEVAQDTSLTSIPRSGNPGEEGGYVEEKPLDSAMPEEKTETFHYNCVLIPNNPQHFLTRQLAERISVNLPWIHISMGWHLTGMAVRPQYLQWTMELPPGVNPATALNEIRRRSSDQLFASFSELKEHEREQDFWAPGYLILTGSQSIPFSMIKTYISRTRDLQTAKKMDLRNG